MVYSAEDAVRARNRCALRSIYVKNLGVEVDMLIPREYEIGDTLSVALLRCDADKRAVIGYCRQMEGEGTMRTPPKTDNRTRRVSPAQLKKKRARVE